MGLPLPSFLPIMVFGRSSSGQNKFHNLVRVIIKVKKKKEEEKTVHSFLSSSFQLIGSIRACLQSALHIQMKPLVHVCLLPSHLKYLGSNIMILLKVFRVNVLTKICDDG